MRWRRRPILLTLVAAVWLVPSTGWAQQVVCPPKETPTSLVRIESEASPGGTGVVIARGPGYAIVLTAKHVIAPSSGKTFWVHFSTTPSRRLPVTFTDESVLIFPPDGDVDLAMFRVDGAIPQEVVTEDPITGEIPAGARFLSFGFPNARGGVLCSHDGKLLRTAAGELVIDPQVEEGVSGGPAFLVDPRGGARRLAGIVFRGDRATTSALDIRPVVVMVANTKDPRNGGKPYPWPQIELKDVFPVNSRLSPLIQVRRGEFLMGSSRGDERFPAESGRPAGPKLIALPTFFISQHEITVAQYRVCVAADKCPEPGKKLGSDRQDHPVTGVSWHDVRVYVEWLQGELAGSIETSRELRRLLDLNWTIDLPSEEEWEKAARLDGAEFPWGNDANQRCANYNTDELRAVGSSNRCGTYAYGLADMAGNVQEWTRGLMLPYPYDEDKPEISAAAGPRVVRGGSAKRILPGAERVRSANREALDPNTADEFTGFRVVLVCKNERGCDPPESQ